MTQNFDPNAVHARLTTLEEKMELILKSIGHGASEAFQDLEADVRDLEEKMGLIEPIIPIVPVLKDMHTAQVAGEGATVNSGQVIPAEQLGEYHNPPKTEAPPVVEQQPEAAKTEG